MPVDPNRESWKPGMGWEQAIADIEYVRGLAREMGGPERIERQHREGRSTIRERLGADRRPRQLRRGRPAGRRGRATTRTATSGPSRRVPT